MLTVIYAQEASTPRGREQHDVFEWNLHRQEFSEHHYTLAITAYEKWKRDNPPSVPFAVVVRLEETRQAGEIYNEVKNAPVALQIQARTWTSRTDRSP